MKIIFRIVATILFILFFGFALENTQEAVLRFFFNYEIRGPLILLLLGFFIGGAVLGILAMIPTLFRHRRDLTRQRQLVTSMEKERESQLSASLRQPQPDSVVSK